MGLAKIRTIVLCVLVVSAVSVACAAAAEEPDGTWNPTPVGTKVAYNVGMNWEVTGVDGFKVYRKGDRSPEVQDVSWYSYRGLFDSIAFSDGKDVTFDAAAIDKLFPLKVGNKTTISASKPGWKWKTILKVTSYKEVKTKLGKRPVFGIAFLEKGDGGFRSKGWIHYDPELGFWHRGKYIVTSGDGSETDILTTLVKLPE